MAVRDKIAHPKKAALLAAYEESGGNLLQASKAAKVARSMHYRWLDEDEVYHEAFAEARAAACDILEAEAVRRAIKGVRKGVYYLGRRTGYELVYSDTLLIFLLKGNRPDKYRDRVSTEISGPGGRPIETKAVAENDEELDRLADMVSGIATG